MSHPLSLLDRRRIEADLMRRVYETLLDRYGEAEALAVVEAALAGSARDAGRAFAASAPGGPSLEHFSGILETWQGSGALEIADIRRTGSDLQFTVTRCRYAEMYLEMGFPAPLRQRLSCCRDAPFAAGYSPCLSLDRPATIADGAPACFFLFRWSQLQERSPQ